VSEAAATESPRMVCDACGAETDIKVVSPTASCPSCAPSAMAEVTTVHVSMDEGVLVTDLGRLGWRWDVLREETVGRHRREQERERRREEPPRPWWRRLLGR